MTKVLMVQPKTPDSFWTFSTSVKMLGLGASMPPTGLATLAAMLPSDFEVRIVDRNIEPLTDKLIKWANVVMVTGMIVHKDSLRAIIARVVRFSKTIVVGGPYATSYPDEVLAMGATHLVLGEAELTLPLFIKDWQTGAPARIYDGKSESARACAGVTLNSEGKPVITGTPIPRFDLLKLGRYACASLQFSRGCPFGCEFCDITNLFGRGSRTKTVSQFIAELNALFEAGWRGSVFIVDDNFIGKRQILRELLLALIEWQKAHRRPFSFLTETSIDLANEEMAEIRRLMVEAGFQEVFVGIESTNPEVLAGMHKSQNLGKISLGEKVRILQASGLEVMAGFIIGSDGDSQDVCERLFEFIQANGIVMSMSGLLTALRGTKLYERLKRDGRLRGEAKGSNTHGLEFNFRLTDKLDERKLIDSYVQLLQDLFSSRNYFARWRTLWQRRGPYRHLDRLNRSGLLATVRLFHRNLFQRFDWEFWKFMLWTLQHAPRELPQAITHAVKRTDFETITEALVTAYRYPEHVATLAERFEKRLAELRGDFDKRLRKLAKLKRKIDAEATRRWLAIDHHFRDGAKEALIRFRQHLAECAETYCAQTFGQAWTGQTLA